MARRCGPFGFQIGARNASAAAGIAPSLGLNLGASRDATGLAAAQRTYGISAAAATGLADLAAFAAAIAAGVAALFAGRVFGPIAAGSPGGDCVGCLAES